MRTLLHSFYVLLGGISYGVLAPFVKLAFEHGIPTTDSVRLQYLFGITLLLIINILFVRFKMDLRTVIKLLLSGLPMALTSIFYYNSLKYLDASIAIVLLFQYTWMGILLEFVIDRVRPTKEKIFAAVLLFAGSLFAVNIFSSNFSSIPTEGLIWGFLAAMSFAAFLYVSGKVANHVPALRKSLVMALGGTVVIGTFYPFWDFATETISLPFIGLGLLLGSFGIVLPPFLFSLGIPVVGSGLGTILSASELPTTLMLSSIVVSEHITLIQWLGIVVILSGIVLGNYRSLEKG